ncbi:MAG: hypothetical protein WAM60_17030 [Candidatus Promineifilaceae bacterium]
MDYNTFMNLKTAEIAQIVRENGPKVCVFPINGTRRWFRLEYPDVSPEDFMSTYLEAMVQVHLRLCRLFFEHGLDTLIAPMISSIILERGPEYLQVLPKGFAYLINHPDFKTLCQELEIRVRLYGDYRGILAGTPHEHLISFLQDIDQTATKQTESFSRHRLFLGLFGDDSMNTIANLTVRYYQEHGRVPDERTLVELYYGEYIPPSDLFITFGKIATYDRPLLASGGEDLYFTVEPSPYFTLTQLRRIFYDHLFVRQLGKKDHSQKQAKNWEFMREFYQANSGNILGLGKRMEQDDTWYPLSQVNWPDA